MDRSAWKARAKELRRQIQQKDSMGRAADISALIISVMLSAASIAFRSPAQIRSQKHEYRACLNTFASEFPTRPQIRKKVCTRSSS